MKKYYESTYDNGAPLHAYAANNQAEYILTSAYAKDMYNDFCEKYERRPSAWWFNHHFKFDYWPGI